MDSEPKYGGLAGLAVLEVLCFGSILKNGFFSIGFFAIILSIFSGIIIILLLIVTPVFLYPEKVSRRSEFPIIRQFVFFILAIATSSVISTPYSQKIKSLNDVEKDKTKIALALIFAFCFLSIGFSLHYSPEWGKKESGMHQPETTLSPEPVASSQGSKSLKNDEMAQKDVAVTSKDAEKLSSKKENAPPITPLPDTKIKTTATVHGKKNLPFHENWLTLAADPSVITGTNNDCGNKYDAPCLTNRLIELVELKSRENMLLSTDRKLSLVLSFRHSTQNPATGAGTFVELSVGVTETVDGVERSCRFAISSSKGDPAFSTFYKLSGLREKLNIALELMADYLSERISGFVQGRKTLCGT